MCTAALLVSSFALFGAIPVPPLNLREKKAESCAKVKVIDYRLNLQGTGRQVINITSHLRST